MSETPPAGRPAPTFVFEDGAGYELMMGRWSGLVAEPFLDWLALPQGLDWLDSGCGDGSFTERMVRRQRPSSVVGVDPALAQLAFARQRAWVASVRFLEGDAQSLPVPDASVDAAVMAPVLFFVPDPQRGVRELMRVVRPGGTIAAYHWDMAGGGFPLQPIIDAARVEGYELPKPPSNWASTRDASESLWRNAGSQDVQTCFSSFDDFWRTAHCNPRIRDLFASLTATALQRLYGRVREQLQVTEGRPLELKARANAVKGCKR